MREIKFRAWDIVSQEMIELWESKYYELFCSTPDSKPYELMQFTGLKDKNGKEIYEGDIITLEDYGIGIVVFDEAMFQYKPINKNGWDVEEGVKCYAFYPTTEGSVEVIGNIYENPELLEKHV